jgi:16S rRNA A1518/A1519 N6-dimethyltransferase RsmA/KsgA/DIM1 with predicted DNA glycosylase/AP lyase activity
VESSFITIARYQERAPAAILEKLLRMSYRGKRKKIRNSWRAGEALLPVELLEDLGPAAGVDCEKRAEEIDIEAYHSLARLIAASDFR